MKWRGQGLAVPEQNPSNGKICQTNQQIGPGKRRRTRRPDRKDGHCCVCVMGEHLEARESYEVMHPRCRESRATHFPSGFRNGMHGESSSDRTSLLLPYSHFQKVISMS